MKERNLNKESNSKACTGKKFELISKKLSFSKTHSPNSLLQQQSEETPFDFSYLKVGGNIIAKLWMFQRQQRRRLQSIQTV